MSLAGLRISAGGRGAFRTADDSQYRAYGPGLAKFQHLCRVKHLSVNPDDELGSAYGNRCSPPQLISTIKFHTCMRRFGFNVQSPGHWFLYIVNSLFKRPAIGWT